LIEMSNGCICCTLREDLLIEINRLAHEGRFDYLLIESTGISEPMPVAETFTFRDEKGRSLSDVARLDTMVTVIDAYNFLNDYSSQDFLTQRGESLGEEDDRSVVELLIEQIEFCNVIVINKSDLVTTSDLERLKGILKALNPQAVLVCSQFGKVPLNSVLNTGYFNFEQAAEAPGWLKEMRGEHVPETEEYGISSFVYRARRPFHPQRFWNLINTEWKDVIRSKGYFWLASRMEFAGEWSQAGAVCRQQAAGLWWAATNQQDWPEDVETRRDLLKDFTEPFGDRRQELVLIGIHMNQHAITAQLEACTLTDAEMALGSERWTQFDDPFPQWQIEEDTQDT
jgi:G3E family GTPase